MDYNKMKKADLTAQLKQRGLSQAGDMGTQAHRLKLHDISTEYSMEVDGKNICLLKMGELKKFAAKNGVNPMNTQDEILTEVIDMLKKRGKPSSSSSTSSVTATHSSSSSSSSTSTANQGVDPIALARRVLDLDELNDYEGILNIATTKETRVSKNSPAALMRKAYLKLSLLIHPDKLGRTFDQATKAFQALVRAFERLSSPDMAADEKATKAGGAPSGAMQISRSNEGCYRTRVCCPRCKQKWSEDGLDGNPDYFYNFMMTGLKQFTCSTCLCWFGCMTAIHKCPHCKKPFEFSPSDYHRKITCGNRGCEKKFGFYMYHASDRVVKELKQTLREEQEALMKATEAKLRRASRGAARGALSIAEQEQAFTLGLSDCCPRCGQEFEEYSEELQRQHLVECMDDKKHAEFKAKREAAKKAALSKSLKLDKQQSVQSKAVWDILGGQTSQLYLLDENQLKSQAEDSGVSTKDGASKEELIAALARSKDKSLAITDGSGSEGGMTKRKKMRLHDLPSGYQNFTLSQLKALCASFGWLPVTDSKAEILQQIEADIHEYEEKTGKTHQPVMLEAGTAAAPLMILGDEDDMFDPQKEQNKTKKKRKVVVNLDSDDEDGDYLPYEDA